MSEPNEGAEQEAAPAPAPRHGRARGVFVVLLLVLGCGLAPLSLLAVWTRTTVLDTDAYVDTVAPLATNQEVIDAVANRVTERVMTATDLQDRLVDALPPRAAAAAPAMTSAVEGVVHEAAVRILSSEKCDELWEAANRRAHTQVIAALTGETDRGVTVRDGQVILDLSDVADQVRAKVKSLGFDVSARAGQQIDPEIVLFHA